MSAIYTDHSHLFGAYDKYYTNTLRYPLDGRSFLTNTHPWVIAPSKNNPCRLTITFITKAETTGMKVIEYIKEKKMFQFIKGNPEEFFYFSGIMKHLEQQNLYFDNTLKSANYCPFLNHSQMTALASQWAPEGFQENEQFLLNNPGAFICTNSDDPRYPFAIYFCLITETKTSTGQSSDKTLHRVDFKINKDGLVETPQHIFADCITFITAFRCKKY